MDVPETFASKEFKGKDLEYLKKPTYSIESLILEESFVDCNRKHVGPWEFTSHFFTERPILSDLGINPKHIEKAVYVDYYDDKIKQFGKYGVGSSMYTIRFVQYPSKSCLDEELENLFEEGIKFYKSKNRFMKRFLFKDKIAIYIDGNEEFIKKSVNYYRKLGFKQLSCTIKAV